MHVMYALGYSLNYPEKMRPIEISGIPCRVQIICVEARGG
jgi:hypothetical protein